jgi:RND family efflux transporter MFP subunit
LELPVNSEKQVLSAAQAPRRRRFAVILPVGVALGTLGVLAWSAWPLLYPAREVRVVQAVFDRTTAPDADVVRVADQREVPTVQAAGWLEAEPFYVAAVALADGVVETIHVLAGEHVEEGTVVARLVAEDSELRLQRAEAELAKAQARHAHAQSDLTAAERTWEAPIELTRGVETAKAALAESRAELAQLPALIDAAQAQLKRLEEEFSRVKQSQRVQASSDIEVIIARQRFVGQRAEVEALRARRPMLEARIARLAAELKAAERHLALRIEDRQRVDAARAAVAAAEAEVAETRAERDEAQLELDRMVIRAPITGYVQRRLKAPGDKVVRNMDDPYSAHLVHLYDPARLQVRVDVPLADAAHVYVGQECEVIVEVLPNRTFRGEVLRSTHEADLQKNTLQFKVRVIDPAPILRPEMLTRVRFLPPGDAVPPERGTAQATRVLIPAAALDSRDGATRVWLVTKRRADRGQLLPVPVEVIEQQGDWLLVRGALKTGALITTDFDQARNGETVVLRQNSAAGGSV